MRPFRLARIAAEAEAVRWRALLSRIVTRAILGMAALIFALGALAFGHLAVWYWLRTELDQTFLAATGILGGADLLVAIVLGVLAGRSAPGRVELQALEVRRQAIQSMGSTLSLTQLAFPLLRLFGKVRRRRRA